MKTKSYHVSNLGSFAPERIADRNDMNWKSFSVTKWALFHGCKAETPQGVARFLRHKHPRDWVSGVVRMDCGQLHASADINGIARDEYIERQFLRVQRHALYDAEAAEAANLVVRGANRRLKNWERSRPTRHSRMHQQFEKGRYKGVWSRKTVYSYTPLYHSALHLYRSGKTVEIHAAGKMVRRILAPAGLRFGADAEGVMVAAKDGTDYHPTATEWRSPKFAGYILGVLALKRKAIKAQKRTQRESRRMTQIRERGMATCRVTLEDSRRAGNCVEGSLRFAEARLGVSREQIVAGDHLVHVSGDRLLSTGDERARRAVEIAWARETTISI